VDKLAQDIKLMRNGRLDVQVYAAGEWEPAMQAFEYRKARCKGVTA